MSDLNNKTFSNRSNAVRAMKNAGYTTSEYNLHKTGDGAEVRVSVIEQLSAFEVELLADYGTLRCPHCFCHLSNGVMGYAWLREEDPKAAAKMTHQFECMGCGEGFGKPRAKRPAGSTRAASTVRTVTTAVVKAPRVKQNGVTHPLEGSSAGKVWALADRLNQHPHGPVTSVSELRIAAEQEGGYNANQVTIEFYQWRKFHGYARMELAALLRGR